MTDATRTIPGDASPDAELRAECSHCSCREGAERAKVTLKQKASERRVVA